MRLDLAGHLGLGGGPVDTTARPHGNEADAGVGAHHGHEHVSEAEVTNRPELHGPRNGQEDHAILGQTEVALGFDARSLPLDGIETERQEGIAPLRDLAALDAQLVTGPSGIDDEVDEGCAEPKYVVGVIDESDRRAPLHPRKREERNGVVVVDMKDDEVGFAQQPLKRARPGQQPADRAVDAANASARPGDRLAERGRHRRMLARQCHGVGIVGIGSDPAPHHAR